MITPKQFVDRLIEDWNSKPGSDDESEEIGDDVTVVSDGQAFSGKVAEKDPRDPRGEVKVSFRGPRPPKDKFKPDELRHDDPKGKSTQMRAINPLPPVSSRQGHGPGSFL